MFYEHSVLMTLSQRHQELFCFSFLKCIDSVTLILECLPAPQAAQAA